MRQGLTHFLSGAAMLALSACVVSPAPDLSPRPEPRAEAADLVEYPVPAAGGENEVDEAGAGDLDPRYACRHHQCSNKLLGNQPRLSSRFFAEDERNTCRVVATRAVCRVLERYARCGNGETGGGDRFTECGKDFVSYHDATIALPTALHN